MQSLVRVVVSRQSFGVDGIYVQTSKNGSGLTAEDRRLTTALLYIRLIRVVVEVEA
jgi:hypothetical protein